MFEFWLFSPSRKPTSAKIAATRISVCVGPIGERRGAELNPIRVILTAR